jgi:uncharacterized protein YcbK (DUF882 family)
VRVVVTTSLMAFWAGAFLPTATETAEANGDTRTISLYHAHRHDSIEATYRVNGHYDPAVLEKLNYFLRDWRNDDQTKMDPRLFDVVWEVYRTAGATEPITVLSAYRSPETNAMLRRRSRAVAEHSQHMLGKAMDTTMPDMSMEKLREIGMRMQRGGVGYYPSSNFVHLDVGSVRHWPRMSYDQLARLFPDGKTVHIPSNGQPLPRYEEARAEIEANGGIAPDYQEQPKSKGFFAWLFGGGGSGEDDVEEVASAVPTPHGGPARGASRNPDASFVASANPPPAAQSLAERYGQRRAPDPAQTAAAPAPGSQQVASLQPTAPRGKQADADTPSQDADTSAYGSVLPIPPKRPSELMTLAAVPLPPARPAGVATFASIAPNDTTASIASDAPKQKLAAAAKPDAIASLISTPSPVHPAELGHAALPAVITQGPDRVKASPADVLAYAATPAAPESSLSAPLPGLRSAALNKTTPSRASRTIVSARLDGSNFRSLTSDTSTEETPSQSVLGPSLSGLRAAARIQAGTLSNGLSANYVARFASTATDLDTAHFSGAAVQPLPSARDSLQLVASFSRPRN